MKPYMEQFLCCFSLLYLISTSVACPTSLRRAKATACGYESCAPVDPNKLNVHLVAHSHDDVGWLKTLDQYYYGSRNNIQNAGVQYIIDSVIDALKNSPQRKFIQVETAFFWKWWVEQDIKTQQLVKDLVNEGRLEFIGGAWSMNDEAASHYYSTIDQFTWGLRKLNDTFGACGRPHVGWQIDPFGHSREMASILARMGYDGLLFARLDYQDKNNRLLTKTAEMIWRGSANLGASAELFTSVLYDHYGPPSGFCFDIMCSDQPFIDDKKSPDYNVDTKVEAFLNYTYKQASFYTTNNIILTMGGDFNYQDAITWFKNLDKLIKYANAADKNLNVIYSTPSCYLKAVNDAGQNYTTKDDDFFPYASDPHSYWTGYFTSRPTSKYFERLGNNFLQVVKQLEAVTQLGQVDNSPLDSLREAMGVLQHHDAITGTEKQHVANDYHRLLTSAIEDARVAAESAINFIIADGANAIGVQNCLYLNVSFCPVSEKSDRFVVTVYNPLSHAINHTVRLPVIPGTYSVQDPNGLKQAVQLVPIPETVLNLPERESSSAVYDLVFRAQSLPPLGFRSYYITRNRTQVGPISPSDDLTIGHSNLQLSLDNGTGLVKSVVKNGEEFSLDQNFYYYEGYIGNNMVFENRSSGAYIFRPKTSSPKRIYKSAQTKVYRGEIVDEIHQTFTPWVSQVVRIYKDENHIEFEWLVGPIPIEDGIGKEIVSRFTSDLATDGLFYTDSNGRELLKRKRNFRPTWDLDIVEPAAGNYYPITSKILIRDPSKGQELAVLNDRAQGGSSLIDGQVELMVHRRLLHDDAFGVEESLNETAYGSGLIARGKHFLMVGDSDSPSPTLAAQEREVAQRKLLSPWLFFSEADLNFEAWQRSYKMEFSGLNQFSELPPNIHIHTLEPWKNQSLLLRLDHVLENDEDPRLSQPVTIYFEDIFSTFTVTSSHETTLAANQWKEDLNRLTWKSTTSNSNDKRKKNTDIGSKSVTISPMEIRTYIIKVSKR